MQTIKGRASGLARKWYPNSRFTDNAHIRQLGQIVPPTIHKMLRALLADWSHIPAHNQTNYWKSALIIGGYRPRILLKFQSTGSYGQSLRWTRLRAHTMRWRLPEQGPRLWKPAYCIALYCIVLYYTVLKGKVKQSRYTPWRRLGEEV
jgi:hypothetical protein